MTLARRLVVVLLLPVLAACSTPAPPAGAPSASATPPGAASPSASPTGPPQITLAFAGDVHFTERTLRLLADPATAFGPVAQVLSAADLSAVNLETAVTERGTPEPKQFHFRAPATAFAAVKAAGIDVVSQANNHALDYGRVGLDDTLAAAKAAGVPLIGAGRTATEAYAPWVSTVKGVRIAIVGLSQIAELSSTWAATDNRSGLAYAFDQARAVAAIRAARQAADVVVVFMHWGQEYNQCPTAQQRSFAKAAADAGATIVVGTHAHVLQGAGWLGKTYVAYGMSNFLWWYNDAGSNDTGVVRITLSGASVASTEFVPAYIDRTTGQPVPSTGAEAQRISTKFAGLRPCTELSAGPT